MFLGSTTHFQEVKNHKIYSPNDIDFVLKSLEFKTVKSAKKIEYINLPCSFDIETTSITYQSNRLDKQTEKYAFMYEWTLNLDDFVIVGREWEEFMYCYKTIYEFFNTGEFTRLVIFVHNLAYEFQFIRKRLQWLKVFSLESRKPVQAVTIDGIEFRCSLILSGYSLENLGNQLVDTNIRKLVGSLDYSKKRHSKTPLTEEELAYCVYDTLVVTAYIRQTIKQVGDITKLPLTKTGFVRKYCRDCCMYEGSHRKKTDKFKKYRKLMKSLTISVPEYKQLKRAFAGGFTHANPLYSGDTMTDIGSFDFTSSYPYVMVSEQFPMSRAELINIKSEEEFQESLKYYCCLFDVSFTNITTTVTFENYISVSHCRNLEGCVENNGRVVKSNRLDTTITEQDFKIIEQFYTWDDMKIFNFRRYKKSYLPRDFVYSILDLYVKKTQLKDINGKEVEYSQSKEKVNAAYGMTVTDPCRDEILYEDDWDNEEPDIEDCIAKYNKSIKRFLFYPWGVWVTAYARRNLFTGIYEFKDDYCYSDTDSVKGKNVEKHLPYIEWYNNLVRKKLDRAMKFQGIDIEMTRPKNKYGKIKELGIWDFEGTYTRFKTLGAKRYMTEKDGKISLTVSGLNKRTAIPYLLDKYGEEGIFDAFNDELYIPADYTGKMTHTYLDEEQTGYIVDYTGLRGYFNELSSVHLENAEYTLSLASIYVDYLFKIKNVSI